MWVAYEGAMEMPDMRGMSRRGLVQAWYELGLGLSLNVKEGASSASTSAFPINNLSGTMRFLRWKVCWIDRFSKLNLPCFLVSPWCRQLLPGLLLQRDVQSTIPIGEIRNHTKIYDSRDFRPAVPQPQHSYNREFGS